MRARISASSSAVSGISGIRDTSPCTVARSLIGNKGSSPPLLNWLSPGPRMARGATKICLLPRGPPARRPMHATMTDRARVVSPCQAEFRASLLHFGHRQINYRLNSQLQISLDRCPVSVFAALRRGWPHMERPGSSKRYRDDVSRLIAHDRMGKRRDRAHPAGLAARRRSSSGNASRPAAVAAKARARAPGWASARPDLCALG